MAADRSDPAMDAAETIVAAPIRAACVDLHPSDALRAAVLLGLPARPPAPSPSRRWRLVATAAGLAAAAVIGAVLWPRSDVVPEDPRALPAAPGSPADAERVAIAQERAVNRALYESEIGRLRASAMGKWVMMSAKPPPDLQGAFKPVVIGETVNDVWSFAPHAKHRYVFRVGDEGDVETFASEWYAPRFAGSGFSKALGITTRQADNELVVSKGGTSVRFADKTPFPRASLVFETAVGGRAQSVEAWLGSVGPTLMLTPEDDKRLSLSRFEVPGTETVMGVPCRRVVVRASIVGLGDRTEVVAAVPDVPYERLVALSRARHSFWSWPDSLRSMLDLPGEDDARGPWIVFGNDRVLGRGPTAGTAVADADTRTNDVVYQRFVVRWPTTEAAPVGRDSFDEPCVLSIGGTSWKDSVVLDARRCATPEAYTIAPLDDATWVALGLHRAESPHTLVLDMEERSDGKPAGKLVPLGREAYVRARVGSTLTGKIEEIVASRFVLVVEDPTMAKARPPR